MFDDVGFHLNCITSHWILFDIHDVLFYLYNIPLFILGNVNINYFGSAIFE